MSGRFGKLELQQSQQTRAVMEDPRTLGTPVRTPEHDLRMADEACRAGCFETALQMHTHALRTDRALIRAWVGQVQMLVELGEYPEARLWADKALELFKNNGELLAAKAQACLRAGSFDAAMACTDASMQSPGSSAYRWRVRAEVLLRRAAERARDCFEKSLAETGTDWFDRVQIARAYLFHGRAGAAIPYAQAAVDLQPASAYASLILGKVFAANGMRERAAAAFERSMQLPGGKADAQAALLELRSSGRATHLMRRIGGLFKR